ncbi:MAG: hypothetical protein MCS20_00905 [Candidatus Phytoplasma mali]|nr:hypothetical protein [Candidatus Phytoplasma australiense]MCG7201960.1 hypothetical protein [Candidatus Phytoplasma mali]MCZ8631802.1 hypothetical protein [Spiroplasma sp. Tabriz.8]
MVLQNEVTFWYGIQKIILLDLIHSHRNIYIYIYIYIYIFVAQEYWL